MKPMGGSEILYNNLIKYVGTFWQDKVNLIMSLTDPRVIDHGKINVVWQHLYTDQGAAQGMIFPEFTDFVHSFVYVSEWQLAQFVRDFAANSHNNRVIKNAIEPIEFQEKPKDKIRLVYTSMPDRGLEVLLDAWRIMNRKDVELIVYSSSIIYGKGYHNARIGLYEKLFHICKTTPGIQYRGYGVNQAVRKTLQQSHILAYPSIYPETSCLAAIEAGAAGCKIVTTDFGALNETCNGWATQVPYTTDFKKLAQDYAEVLNTTIDNYWSDHYNLKDQSDWFNDYYSWSRRAEEWRDFLSNLL